LLLKLRVNPAVAPIVAMLLIAQITDTHLFADNRQIMFDCPTNDTFAAVIAAIEALQPQPDLLLLTGDISQDETAASYEYARAQIGPLQIPTYWLPGNHDQNPATLQVLNGEGILPDKVVTEAGWRLILLDSMVPKQPHGKLSESQLDWLEQQLEPGAEIALPTLVAIHHHTLACGLAHMDGMALQNAAQFWEIADRHPQIKVVLSGHIHQEFAAERNGVQYFGTPSTCVQLKPNQPQIEADSLPPGFRLLRLYPDGQVETEVRWVETSPASTDPREQVAKI
jgi:3',5'-cyclic-AMP phosphodiesterase